MKPVPPVMKMRLPASLGQSGASAALVASRSADSKDAGMVVVLIARPGSRILRDALARDRQRLLLEIEPLLLDHHPDVAGPLGAQPNLIADEAQRHQHYT